MAPVGEDRARELLASACAAAIVYDQDRVPVRGEELPLQTERMLILPVRPAVNAQQQRNLRSFPVTERVGQQAVDLSSFFLLKLTSSGGGISSSAKRASF